jgi:hypothetical protein
MSKEIQPKPRGDQYIIPKDVDIRLDPTVVNDLLKAYGEHLRPQRGDFSIVQGYFSEKDGEARRRLEKRLKVLGYEMDDADFVVTSSMGHFIDEKEFPRVSKSQRVTHGIDVVRKGGSKPLLQMYVKFTEGLDENRIAVLADERGWSGTLYNVQYYPGEPGKKVREGNLGGGFIVEERLAKGNSLRKQGLRFTESMSSSFGSTLGGKVRDMAENGVVFNFGAYGATNVRLVPKGNAEIPFILKENPGEDGARVDNLVDLYNLVKRRGPRVLRHHMRGKEENDFARWIREGVGDEAFAARVNEVAYDARDEGKTKSALLEVIKSGMYDVKFIGNREYTLVGQNNTDEVVSELIGVVRQLSNIGRRARPHAWKSFEEGFVGDAPEGWNALYGVEGERYRWRRNVLAEVRRQMCNVHDPISRKYWGDFFQAVDQSRPLQLVDAKEEDVDFLTNSIEGTWIGRSVSAAIATDIGVFMKERGGDARDVVLTSERESGVLELHARNTACDLLRKYIIQDVSAQSRELFVAASNYELAPKMLDTEDPAKVAYVLDRSVSLKSLNEEEALEFGAELADSLGRAFKRRIVPTSLDQRNTLFHRTETGYDVVFTDWMRSADPRKEQTPDERADVIKSGIVAAASLIRSLPHYETAWKSFRNSFTTAPAETREDVQFFRKMMHAVEKSLSEDAGWRDFFEKSRKATLTKRGFRFEQDQWLQELRERDTRTRYHQDTRAALGRLEPTIHRAIESVYEIGKIEDVIADARHLHIYVPGGEDTVVDAKLGAAKMDKGFILFELYQMEHTRARSLENRFIVEFNGDQVGTPQRVTDEMLGELMKSHVSPAAFKVHLTPAGERQEEPVFEVGGQRYCYQWNENYFSRADPSIAAVRAVSGGRPVSSLSAEESGGLRPQLDALRRQVAVEDEWERSLNVIVTSFPDWLGTIKGLLDIRDGLSPEDAETFILGTRRSGMQRYGLSVILDPKSPLMFDGSESEPHRRFEFYSKLPDEVLDSKIHGAYGPRLDAWVSEVLTSEPIADLVREEINRRGTLPTLSDFIRLSNEGGVERFTLASNDPKEFLRKVEYVKDGGHLVYRFTVRSKEGKDRTVIMKHTNAWDDAYLTGFASVLGYRTPIAVPLSDSIVLETDMPGKRLMDDPETIAQNQAQLAVMISGLTGIRDMSVRNGMVEPSGTISLIDFDVPPMARTPGLNGIISEWATLEDCAPDMKTPDGRTRILAQVRSGLEAFERKINDGQINTLAMGMIDRASKTPSTSISPEFAEEFKRRATMPAAERMKELLFWRARAEEERVYAYGNDQSAAPLFRFNPMFHLGYVQEVMAGLSPGKSPDELTAELDPERFKNTQDLMSSYDAIPYALGAYARLAGVTGFEDGTVRYDRAGRQDSNAENRQYYTAGRLIWLMEGYGVALRRDINQIATSGVDVEGIKSKARADLFVAMRKYFKPRYQDSPPPGFMINWGPHDTANEAIDPKWGSPDQRIAIGRELVGLRDLSQGWKKPVEVPPHIEQEFRPITDKSGMQSHFLRGFEDMDRWLHAHKDETVAAYGPHAAKNMRLDAEALVEHIGDWYSENARDTEGIDFTDRNVRMGVVEPVHQTPTTPPRDLISSARFEKKNANTYARRYHLTIRAAKGLQEDVEAVYESLESSTQSPGEKYPAYIALTDLVYRSRSDGDTLGKIVKALGKEADKPDEGNPVIKWGKRSRTRYYMTKPPGDQYNSVHDGLIDRIMQLREAQRDGTLDEALGVR